MCSGAFCRYGWAMTSPEITATTVPEPATEAVAPAASTPAIPLITPTQMSEALRRPATLSDLMGKKRRKLAFTVNSMDDDGHALELVVNYQAISPVEYDELISQHPPTAKQKGLGMDYNPETFGPALVERVSIEPKISGADVKAMIASGSWSPGEIDTITGAAYLVCQQGAGIPFTVSV